MKKKLIFLLSKTAVLATFLVLISPFSEAVLSPQPKDSKVSYRETSVYPPYLPGACEDCLKSRDTQGGREDLINFHTSQIFGDDDYTGPQESVE